MNKKIKLWNYRSSASWILKDIVQYGFWIKTLTFLPVAHSVQLIFKCWLMLFQHIPQRNSHMFPVFSFCTLQTHGCFTWFAVKLHHLQMVQWSARQLNIIFVWVNLLINSNKNKIYIYIIYTKPCNNTQFCHEPDDWPVMDLTYYITLCPFV